MSSSAYRILSTASCAIAHREVIVENDKAEWSQEATLWYTLVTYTEGVTEPGVNHHILGSVSEISFEPLDSFWTKLVKEEPF